MCFLSQTKAEKSYRWLLNEIKVELRTNKVVVHSGGRFDEERSAQSDKDFEIDGMTLEKTRVENKNILVVALWHHFVMSSHLFPSSHHDVTFSSPLLPLSAKCLIRVLKLDLRSLVGGGGGSG